MLEIGTANGYSAIQFALELRNTGGKITTIEFSTLSHGQAVQNFETAGVQDLIDSRLGNALDILPTLEETYDFVFIDGMKRRTKDFLELVWEKVPEGGIIIVDDVIKFREKMVGFWEYLEEKNIAYNIIPIDIDDGIVMIVK
jgi:predicted O-methyltransferase YrrM